MASSNIKLFDENKGNMLSDSEFSISNQRMNGLQTGVASSQLQNKAMYQASLISYAIAQIMMQNGKNANDTDAVSAFVANLSSTMLQKVYDIATTAEAQAGVATGKWMSPALVKAEIDTLAAKAQNILSDNTKALYGLGADALPDDVLSLIADNLNDKLSYVWQRYRYDGLTFGDANTTTTLKCTGYNDARTVYYSDSVIVKNPVSGVLELAEPITSISVTFNNYGNYTNVLRGKYFYTQDDPTIYHGDESTTRIYTSGGSGSTAYYVYIQYAQKITVNYTKLDDVYSLEPSAYPAGGFDSSGSVFYIFAGMKSILEAGCAKAATGSYTGTGTYGISNPNSLTFDFNPQLLFVWGVTADTSDSSKIFNMIIFCGSAVSITCRNSDYISRATVTCSESTVSWYSTNDAALQGNYRNTTYKYLAIG